MSSDELKHEVTRLKDCLVRAEPCKYQQVLVGWCDEVQQQHGEAAGNFAFDLLTIIKICGVPNFIHQEINVNRNVNVGGDVTGSVIGDSNLTEIGDVSVYKNDVDQAATINPELKGCAEGGPRRLRGVRGLPRDEKNAARKLRKADY